jgi:hypothetical protein
MAKRVSLKGQGASIFFGDSAGAERAPSPPPVQAAKTPVEASPPSGKGTIAVSAAAIEAAPTNSLPVERSSDRLGRSSSQAVGEVALARTTTRHSFELYQDQVDRLRRIALEDKLTGGEGNMSEMVRTAIDDYLGTGRRAGSR